MTTPTTDRGLPPRGADATRTTPPARRPPSCSGDASIRRRGRRGIPILAVLAVLLLALTTVASACGGSSSETTSQPRELAVFAAASLTEAFTQIGEDFTAAHPDITVSCNFAGSNDLATQLQQGAPADVFASADTTNMDKVLDLVDTPQTFARNKLCIAVAPGNPEGVTGLDDLSRKDLKVVLAAPEVPAGKYADEILGKAGVTVDPVSLEITVKGVVTKVALGEADAGIVYVTDVAAAEGEVEAVDIPDDENVIAVYPIATVIDGEHPDDAQTFVDFVLSADGQKVLTDDGFLPPK